MSRALKQADERKLSKLYETEFNKPDLHDRVLIFDVVASWPCSLESENEGIKNEATQASNQRIQSEDGSSETVGIGNWTSVNTNDENETQSKIASKYANGEYYKLIYLYIHRIQCTHMGI
jgi:hypothetical protein